jgi:hypothetical protein
MGRPGAAARLTSERASCYGTSATVRCRRQEVRRVSGFRCGICDRFHDHVARDIAFRRPDAYFDVPEEERERRVYETDDLCTIDGDLFLIRGVLYLPIDGLEERFGWGIWVSISEDDYYDYLDAWDNDTEDETPPFAGQVASAIAPYPGALELDVTVKLRSGGSRPTFTVISDMHPLGIDQRKGISEQKAHAFLEHYP